MKQTSLFILKLLLICAFLFTSCENDEILTEPSLSNQNQLSKIFQNSFDSKKFTKTLPYKYNVDWSNPVKQYSEELEIYFYEFPIIYSDSYNPDIFNEQIKRDFYQKYKVVVTENEEGKFDFFIAKYFLKNIGGNTEVENSKLSLNTNKGYKGTLHLYDKEATITFAKHINNDKENKSFYSKNVKLKSTEAKWVNVCKTITTYHYKDWFWVVYNGYGNIISSTFLYTTFEGTSQKQECLQQWMPDPIIPKTPCTAFECNGVYYEFEPGIACQIGYKNDGLGNCVKVPTLNGDDDFDDQIFNELTGKALCVYNKLNSASTGFANAIKKFDGKFPVSHLKFSESSTLPSNINAQTYPPQNYITKIEINTNNMSRPNLSIARTIIHEVIHAEMYRKVLSLLRNGGNLNGLTEAQWKQKLSNGDYPGIFDYYSRFGEADMDHELMAVHYRTVISDFLKEFEPGLSEDIYDALAWEGLRGTTTWNSLNSDQRYIIDSIISNFNNRGSENCAY